VSAEKLAHSLGQESAAKLALVMEVELEYNLELEWESALVSVWVLA